ncbi:helix-turn-helix domain-containing protein [Leptospira sp. 2 VSF19]|uniref:Helix-turn-helix domain-containing protein n=1 Tax=Leptospira soteropolitanensis TaxID=2950025 RepID=A0AAW5VMZ2_9LEPT|nr:helix-turn-helix domain-containing protein [Leptospira soteropolitanensis]MCW7492495.1 helix-turn-helix domain-containing protein [Leptospira soteropolitanensis]MCW7500545.1 helix-turn-helix domain-containing protein [Leptospira soteropolitanensis]MCW7522785.1 helix-turn-helix domain-containing protein [Leptospira soteropolitanensis]MCW7526643.1 helix-turn-helix domain-containing protein [Leptospira soteropolitanensis]MCW7530515.1 helix-turn-helix domain-containing protein [Leptospira soter
MKTNRTGIWIPVWIEELNLSHSQTKLYAEIVSLHEKGGCFASNRYFGELLGLKMDTVSRLITSLKKLGLLEQTGFDGRKRYLKPLFSKPTAKEMQMNSVPLEKSPMVFPVNKAETIPVSMPKKSNAGLEKIQSPFNSTIEVQKRLQKKNSWDEFKIWSETTLSKSTYHQISKLSSPDFLQGTLNLIWKNWMETQNPSMRWG